jgi:uncharacterized protein YecT (DUF1311 family)
MGMLRFYLPRAVAVFLAALLTSIAAAPALASPVQKAQSAANAISKKCEKQFESSGRGADWHYAQCEELVHPVWEEALNKVLTDLLSVLPKTCGSSVREAHQAWLAYRDADAVAFDASAGVRPGRNMLTSAERRTSVLKSRLVLLVSLAEAVGNDASTLCTKE